MKTRTCPEAGFTLVELMVTIVIGAILISIAVPSYQLQIRKSRRTEAKTAILDLASREERLFSTTNSYSQAPADLGYPGAWPQQVGSGYYTVSVTAPAVAGTTPATFTITATAINSQVKDTQCRTFTVDQTGLQASADANAVNTNATCLN
jgi:type IV pilus assembly protein PilE